MKTAAVLLFFFVPYIAVSQKIQVMVPEQVVVGTAFQVQYIVTEPSEYKDVITPQLDSCRLISGPHIYKGIAVVDKVPQPILNITYTLVPAEVGLLKIKGVRVRFNNAPDIQCIDAYITIISPPKASFSVQSSYTDVSLYAPSKKDREKLIDKNIFINAAVNKSSCYEGEPVVATFKLYSRLQSSSEAEKSPSFYGFSVVDILSINEAHTAVETVNEKVFNTSILRQVQLYPVQSGLLTIDPLYVQNAIEFDDSITHRKSIIEKEIVTRDISVNVIPLPTPKPKDFTGAVGTFLVEAYLEKNSIPFDSQGKLVIRIRGKGNFIQFGQPVINWPDGIEPFEPTITDKLNKSMVPIEGERVYVFGFSAASAGHFAIAPLSFSFFDTKTALYKKISTDSLHFIVTNKTSIAPVLSKKQQNFFIYRVLFAFLLLSTAVFIFFRWKKKAAALNVTVPSFTQQDYLQQLIALDVTTLSEKQACIEIQRILSAFEISHFSLLSDIGKGGLKKTLQDCQMQIYSSIPGEKKEVLKQKAIELVSECIQKVKAKN